VQKAHFDPNSPGARKLARDWLPHLERWEVRIAPGRSFVEPDGTVIRAGETMDVPAPLGRQAIDQGTAELIRRYRISAHE
jgi:hypothetical protein